MPQEGIMIEEPNIEDTSTVEKKISLLKLRGERSLIKGRDISANRIAEAEEIEETKDKNLKGQLLLPFLITLLF